MSEGETTITKWGYQITIMIAPYHSVLYGLLISLLGIGLLLVSVIMIQHGYFMVRGGLFVWGE